jgi:hypothetical protein
MRPSHTLWLRVVIVVGTDLSEGRLRPIPFGVSDADFGERFFN